MTVPVSAMSQPRESWVCSDLASARVDQSLDHGVGECPSSPWELVYFKQLTTL